MPIRYISAVILAVAVIGLAFVGVEQVATDNSQHQMEREIDDIETVATSLVSNEELPPAGLEGAQRYVTVELPEDSLTSMSIDYFELNRTGGNVSMAEYQLSNGATSQRLIEVPITNDDSGSIRLEGTGVTHELVLTLERSEDGERVVNIRRATG